MWKHSLVALTVLTSTLGFSAAGASAFPAPPAPASQTADASVLTEARYRGGGGSYRGMGGYNHYHGNYRRYGYRNYCNSWNHNCGYHNHYHNNWNGNPWWVLGGIGLGYGLGYSSGYYNNGYYGGGYGGYGGYGNAHVAWCLNRYRSYNPRTNTWVSYSGRVYQCRSPYDY